MRPAWTLLPFLLITAPFARASDITYNVSLTMGSSGTVTGTIETDGTLGALSSGNILDWDLGLSDGVSSYSLLGPLSGSNSTVDVEDLYGHGIFSATATELNFIFDGGYGGVFFNGNAGSASLEFSNEGVPCAVFPCAAGDLLSIGTDNAQWTNISAPLVVGSSDSGPVVPEPPTFPGSVVLASLGMCRLRNKREPRAERKPHSESSS